MASEFQFRTGDYSLVADGEFTPIQVDTWDGPTVAAACADRFVVGAIPFNRNEPARLYEPENWHFGEAGEFAVRTPGDVEESTVQENLQDLARSVLDEPINVAEADRYRQSVAHAVERIRGGELDKVVLSRIAEVSLPDDFDVERLFARLTQDNPSAYCYGMGKFGTASLLPRESAYAEVPTWDGGPQGVIVGASPELVLRTRDGVAETHPLAGSMPRRAEDSDNPQQVQKVLRSEKNLGEHAHVTRAITDAFEHYCDDVQSPETPDLVATPVIWHLGTHIQGRLKPGCSPFELLYELVPTPAVCGWPTDTAFEEIMRVEPFERGLFSGVIGWSDGQGNCEWAMMLRGGIVRDDVAVAFAGAGIVGDSEPESEKTETDTKLMTFLRALLSASPASRESLS